MSVVDKAAFIVAQSAHEQHQSTTTRVSRKLEAHKERRAELTHAQAQLDAKRADTEQMLDGKRKNADGDWVQVSAVDRGAGLVPSERRLGLELRRIAADEKKLNGELEAARREGQAAMGQMVQSQERALQAKKTAEEHAADGSRASRTDRPAAVSSSGDGSAAEAQLTARDMASTQKARQAERLARSAERIEEKVEEAHEHEHDAIDTASAGGFFSALFGVITALLTAVVSVVTVGVGSIVGALTLAGSSLGAGMGASNLSGAFTSMAELEENALAEFASLEKAEEQNELRRLESAKKRHERTEAEAEHFVAELRDQARRRRD